MPVNFEKRRHNRRARLFVILGNNAGALAEYLEAFRVDPGFRKAANAIAWCHASAERYAEAIRYFNEAIKL